MAGFDQSIKVFFGGDTSQLKQATKEAQQQVKGFSDGVGGLGKGLEKLDKFGAAFGIGFALKKAFDFALQAIDNAQKLRDQYELTGQTLDKDTLRVAKFGDAIDALKKSSLDFATKFISSLNKSGEELGELAARTKGMSLEQIKDAERAADGAFQAERKLAEARKKFAEENSRDKLRELQKQLDDTREKNLASEADGEKKVAILLDQKLEIEKKLSEMKQGTALYLKTEIELENKSREVEEARVKAVTEKFDRQVESLQNQGRTAVTFDEKLNSLLNQQYALTLKKSQLQEGTNEFKKTETQLEKTLLDIGELRKAQAEKLKLSTEDQYKFDLLKLKGVEHLNYSEKILYDLYVAETEQKRLQVQIDELLSKGVDNLTSKEKDTLKQLLAQEAKSQQLVDRKQAIVDGANAQVEAEQAVTDEQEKQLALEKQIADEAEAALKAKRDFSGAGAPFTTSAQLQDASDDELKELIRRKKQEVQSNTNPALNSNFFGIGPAIAGAMAQSTVDAAQRELAFRQSTRDTISLQGVDAARQQFKGDPLRFDDVVSRLQNGISETMKGNDLLEKINDGITTIKNNL